MNILNLEWSEKMSVGVESIDSDHKKLILLIRELYFAYHLGFGNDEIPPAMLKFIDYTKYHFDSEETLMREKASPMLAFHSEEHRQLIDRVLAISQEKVSGLSDEVFQFLWDWLIHHVLQTDMATFAPSAGKTIMPR